jgi:large subunit ribosomal protein L21
MYAVFRAGGKQYRASKGERLKIEKLDADEGAKVTFDEVLLVGEGKDIKVGNPVLSGSSVEARVLRQSRTGKVGVTKFRRRQNYLRQHTHRQWFTEVEITGISGDAAGKPNDEAGKATESESASPAKKETTGKKTAKTKTAKAAAGSSAASGKKKAAKKASKKKAAE